ncbi:MAG: cysteine--tRNA ligase, partial [Xanthomonadales bacterium]|nr:cysteine--tRNA ligase [Xanthomonadales bacterium]
KMSKSLGNIEKVHDLVRAHPPEALRHALLSAHYRQPLEWSDAVVEQSVRTLDRLYGTLRDLADVEAQPVIPAGVEAALDDDLNTPQALAEIARIAGEARKAGHDDRVRLKSELLGAGLVLGLLQQAPQAWFQREGAELSVTFSDGIQSGVTITSGKLESIDDMIAERDIAKKNRDFAKADEIRSRLVSQGIILEDTPNGTRWKRA